MLKKAAALGLAFALLSAPMFAGEGDIPKGIPHMDHVFVIMMENHGYQQVINNPNEPFLNRLIADKKVNLATNYFAVGHPSLTNYLEVVGGSNFGIRSDHAPDWHNRTCSPNIVTGVVNADDGAGSAVPAPVPFETNNVCPIAGEGMDAATPAVDNWNEVTLPQFPFLADLDGVNSVPAAFTRGRTIGDQLVHHGLSWKSYQESLPITGADLINYSNGTATNLTDFSSTSPLAPLTSGSVVQDYAVKHNPFAYFRSVQEGTEHDNSLENIVGFEGSRGLFADLARGTVPSLAFIAPNQCNDQHGRGNADAFCAFDPGQTSLDGLTNGTQAGLNGGLMLQGDNTIERLVQAIHHSPVWHDGRVAIVIVWDENDYSGISTPPNGLFPPQNQNTVVLTVETNGDADDEGIQSGRYYNSFSLLKSLESGFRLPCLNHACDDDVKVMRDLFGHDRD